MIQVFIGGSRRCSRLSRCVVEKLESIRALGHTVLVGDANGVDRLVQQHFAACSYPNVIVFCTNGSWRNNIGNWRTHDVQVGSQRKDRAYYSAKDVEMARQASHGLMIWDGESRGTRANIEKLALEGKPVLVYLSPERRFITIRGERDWRCFLESEAGCVQEPRSRKNRTTHETGPQQQEMIFR